MMWWGSRFLSSWVKSISQASALASFKESSSSHMMSAPFKWLFWTKAANLLAHATGFSHALAGFSLGPKALTKILTPLAW